jgi:subtilisin family serine protease
VTSLRRTVPRRTAAMGTVLVTLMAVTAAAPPLRASAGDAKGATADTTEGTYIVVLDVQPAATNDGRAGLRATKPKAGGKYDATSADSRAYRRFVDSRRHEVLARAHIPAARLKASYNNALAGFGANLSGPEVQRLRATPGVRAVLKSRRHVASTVSTPRFLGLDGDTGVWRTRFGGDQDAGLGVIIGVIDSGIVPESPSFAALPEGRPDADVIARKWKGTCQGGAGGPTVTCNNKLIGARYYDQAVLSGDIPANPREFRSPRDFDGHGSHTASTAAGNHGVRATVYGQDAGLISGMAPAARIASYKVLWQVEGSGPAGDDIDIVAGIDQAIADGVDVINASFGPSGAIEIVVGATDLALFNAAQAGVFVVAAAGNDGPYEYSVQHGEPWNMTVAASTHDRDSLSKVTLGDGRSYPGSGLGEALPLTDLVLSTAVAKADVPIDQATLCARGSLDPAKATGKIVVCRRGVVGRIDKSMAVKQAGGVGMVLYNADDNTLNADYHLVPTVHVDSGAGRDIVAYAQTPGATAALAKGVPSIRRAPAMASFSGAGPSLLSNGDLLKPDITAPGVDVLAAVAREGTNGQDFNHMSGTSMAAPHVAGLAALLKSKQPTWPPMWIKSALMTTATDLDNEGKPIQFLGRNATPLSYGAGHVTPAKAFDPGLVYDSSPEEWLQFLCATESLDEPQCEDVPKADVSDLNYPSIAIGDLLGSQTVVRRVTNITERASVYTAQVAAPPGVRVSVSPAKMVVLPGRTATFRITFTRTSVPFGEYTWGWLTWADHRGHRVRSPLVVRAVATKTPRSTGTSRSGPAAVSRTDR